MQQLSMAQKLYLVPEQVSYINLSPACHMSSQEINAWVPEVSMPGTKRKMISTREEIITFSLPLHCHKCLSRLGWDLVMQVSLRYLCSYKWPLTHIPHPEKLNGSKNKNKREIDETIHVWANCSATLMLFFSPLRRAAIVHVSLYEDRLFQQWFIEI